MAAWDVGGRFHPVYVANGAEEVSAQGAGVGDTERAVLVLQKAIGRWMAGRFLHEEAVSSKLEDVRIVGLKSQTMRLHLDGDQVSTLPDKVIGFPDDPVSFGDECFAGLLCILVDNRAWWKPALRAHAHGHCDNDSSQDQQEDA
jgi:hypothetical protein